MTSAIARKLASHWGQDPTTERGASLAAVSQFESSYQVRLPRDMRDYLLQLDGTGTHWPGDQDAKGFSFWQLAQIRPVNEELGAHGMPAAEDLKDYFVFADFGTWLWAYAIRLDDGRSTSNRVVLIGNDKPIHIADSFEEFVELYVHDSARTYGGLR